MRATGGGSRELGLWPAPEIERAGATPSGQCLNSDEPRGTAGAVEPKVFARA